MIIRKPCIITSRLLPGVRIGNDMLSIEYGGESADGRQKYTFFIDAERFEYACDDLRSGVGGGFLQGGLELALSFLDAAAEAYRYGPKSDNYRLFPTYVMEWAYQNEDEISLTLVELEGISNAIEE